MENHSLQAEAAKAVPSENDAVEEAEEPRERIEESEQPASVDELKAEVEELKAMLEEQRSLADRYLDTAKRIQAEFDNYKKRMQKEREEMVQSANERLICDLLNIIDDFERAVESSCDMEELREGVRRIHCNLMGMLQQYGLKEIPAEGKFNPDYHEALSTGEGDDGQILKVYQKGYLLGNRVLRCSKVEVAKRSDNGEDRHGEDDRN